MSLLISLSISNIPFHKANQVTLGFPTNPQPSSSMSVLPRITAKSYLAIATSLLTATFASALPIWINEIHYDNTGGDIGEFIEVAGQAGTSLSGYSLELYNGSSGSKYGNTVHLSGSLSDFGNGYGFLQFDISAFGVSGIQNGAPDGIGLTDGTNVQFLSYEGTFTASNGFASGMTSNLIGVSESSSTPIGHSLQFVGHGTTGSWTGPLAATPGALNTGQVLPPLTSSTNGSSKRTVPDSSNSITLLCLGIAAISVLKRRKIVPFES